MEFVYDTFREGFDLVLVGQFLLRTVVGFIIAMLFVQLGGNRLFLKTAAFDIVVAIMLGSIISRGITGSSPFIPTMAAAMMLVLVHRLVAVLTYRSSKLGMYLKGGTILLVKDGELINEAMRRENITYHDIMNAARTRAHINQLEDIAEAFLERSGDISIIPKKYPHRA